MKFVIIAVAFLVLIFSVQSSIIAGHTLGLGLNGLGLRLNPLGLTSVGLGLNGLGLGIGGINGLGLHNLGLLSSLGLGRRDLSGIAVGVPGQSLSQGPAILGDPAASINLADGRGIIGHGAAGTYVAQTRGAIHTAPLDGHINSAASLNIASAPGTL